MDALKTLNILALAVLIVYFFTHLHWLLWAVLFFLAVGSFENRLARNLAKGWLKFSELLGVVTSKVLLTLVFYFFLVPIALLYRLFHKEMSSHFRNRNRTSFFTEIEKPYSKKSLENPW